MGGKLNMGFNMAFSKEEIFIPNEIFEDFKNIEYRVNTHYAFSICYYVLISYLYYHCKYDTEFLITQSQIKQMLGISKHNKKIDYLIKSGGEIEKIGYIKPSEFIPINKSTRNKIQFEISSNNMYKVKVPIKGFERIDKNGETFKGTFFDVKNTTLVNMNHFREIAYNINCSACLIYIIIKRFKYIEMDMDNFSDMLLMSRRSFVNCTTLLEKRKYIQIIHGNYDYITKKNYINQYF
jgi:hypothetical protein